MNNLAGVIQPTYSTGKTVSSRAVIPSGVAYHYVNGQRVIEGQSANVPVSNTNVSQSVANARMALLQKMFPTHRG